LRGKEDEQKRGEQDVPGLQISNPTIKRSPETR
jgi:hypothetical protein